MPNFHTHWLVALGAINSAPDDVQRGWQMYQVQSLAFAVMVRAKLEQVVDKKAAKAWRDDVEKASEAFHRFIGARPTPAPRAHWYSLGADGTYAAARDDVTAFSAYMLGACGPDFWTVPSVPQGMIPDTAGEQFNLGHYNRTHRQFQASALSAGHEASLQARVQRAYFHGMATHFAADLVIHELVNQSAGAYNLTKQVWYSEQAEQAGWVDRTKNKLKKWTMHNKVEHFWDSLARFKYFGDCPELAKDWPVLGVPGKEPTPQGFLTQEGLLALAGKNKSKEAREALESIIRDEAFRFLVEKPLLFPFVFADRVVAGDGLQPFLYDVVVVDAHPPEVVHPTIRIERRSYQMLDGTVGRTYSEVKKLGYFTSAMNDGGQTPYSLNYLTFVVCPNLERTARFGVNVIFDSLALPRYVDNAIQLARAFFANLKAAYQGVDRTSHVLDDVSLGGLGRFWNLDTGVGLQVRCDGASVPSEVVTTLDFVHVLDGDAAGKLDYRRPPRGEGHLGRHTREATFGGSATELFPLRGAKRFAGWADVEETDTDKYLPRIEVGTPPARSLARPPADLDDFLFDGQAVTGSGRELAATGGAGKSTTVEARKMAKRLTLVLRIRLPRIGATPEELAISIYNDAPGAPAPHAETTAAGDSKEITEEWLVGADPLKADSARVKAGIRLAHYQLGTPAGSYRSSGGTDMQQFRAELLANFEPQPIAPRVIEKGAWNNVVPAGGLGRTFAIATCRKWVLHATRMADQPFAPWVSGSTSPQLELFRDPSPTEQIFFTLFLLAKQPDGKVWDLLGQREVSRSDMVTIRRIDAAGFVKVILYYVVGRDGVSQLETAHIDGIQVPVALNQADG